MSTTGAPKKSRFKLVIILVSLFVVAIVVSVAVVAALTVSELIEQDSPEHAAEEIAAAVSGSDFEALCKLYSDDTQQDLFEAAAVGNCGDYADRRFDPYQTLDVQMKVLDVDRNRASAVVTYSVKWGVAEETHEFTLVDEDGDWKMSTIPDFELDDRPSRAALAQAFIDGAEIERRVAECIADALLDSDLTDAQLNAVASDDRSSISDDDADEVTDIVVDAFTDCGGGAVSG
ncbi:DUF4878 domain-containing protein [Nocardioides humilatus]|uniref:DUF4878 domain-containing protein n=1 Tax=Nocardioides humilatus TaxID=2607660 RepID=A0A5B1LHQ3_9ACTN|nr:DUF4878 domain-containing protein [Nocardioides humilatus]KAA1419169.1 DUF4878 domain-containing protein [Nocardioides humilatus]